MTAEETRSEAEAEQGASPFVAPAYAIREVPFDAPYGWLAAGWRDMWRVPRVSLAQQHIEESCNINPAFFHPRADYLLRVHGMSMKDIGIFDGDLLAVHTTREARNGQIVVARIGDEVTVKRFKREGSKVWLLAENPEFAPIEVNLKDQDLVIEGLSVGVIRR